MSTCVTHVWHMCVQVKIKLISNFRVIGWMAGWPHIILPYEWDEVEKPTSSRRPFSWEPPPGMVCWELTTSQHKIYQLHQRCRKKSEFKFRFRTFLEETQKGTRGNLIIFMSLWVWNRFVFIDEVQGVFHNVLKHRMFSDIFFAPGLCTRNAETLETPEQYRWNLWR